MRKFTKQKRIIALLLLCFVLSLSLCLIGCGEQEVSNRGNVAVTFELEGGSYQNSDLPVLHYYNVEEGSSIPIADPTNYSDDGVTRAGYDFTGWYKTKTQSDTEVIYSDKWDFTNDRITTEGVTLYAGWVKQTNFTYKVSYYDENGEVVVIGSYKVQEGAKFNDYAKYANKRTGYTAIPSLVESDGDVWVYKTANGEVWDKNYTHPGDKENPDVYVMVDYVKGSYRVITTAKDLKSYGKNYNVYLACDIDMAGESLSFGNYNKEFLGNGYTISNFTLQYDNTKDGLISDFENPTENSLYLSLFGNAKGATVKDVNFVNAKVEIDAGFPGTSKIYVSPLFSTLKEGCTVQNVTYSGNYSYEKLPSSDFIQQERLVYVTDRAYYKLLDESSTFESVTVNVTTNQQ